MQIPSAAEVLRTVDRVHAAFPFPGYISRAVRHGLAHVVPEVARQVRAAGKPRLLDIGSGPMDKTAVFQALGFECSAVDDLGDPWHRRGDNLEKIQAFARASGIRFHLQDGTYAIPFPPASFDVVTIFDVIEHLHESPRGILNAAGTQLKTGGVLAVTMPNSVNLRKRLSVLCGRTNYPDVDQFYLSPQGWRGHVREYTLGETARLCEAAGFRVESATAFEGNAYDMLRGAKLRAYLALSSLFPTLRSALLVVARKPEGWAPKVEDPEAFRRSQVGVVPQAVL
ncbi:MAG TPA: class I SAM-dependent methyltransferase [Longimicrobium sp.]|nr:class I SAM-dependent methyltransferase [Longimicrobium sp.]